MKSGRLFSFGPLYGGMRDSGGGLLLACWHRAAAGVWRWAVSWQPYRGDERRHWVGFTAQRGYQAHYSLHLLRCGRLRLSTQKYPRLAHP